LTAARAGTRAPFRTIAITGGSSGLGASLALSYAGPGMRLALVGRDPDRLAATARLCEAKGAAVTGARIDVADAAAIGSFLIRFDEAQPIDLLIANAGISAGPPPGTPSESHETTTRQVAVNLLGTVNTVAPLAPRFCARGQGRIVVVASIAAYRGMPYSPGYCASKAGVRAYGEALRPSLAACGVGVTVVCPGFFQSPMTDRWEGPTPFLFTGEQAARRVKRGIDGGRRRISFPFPLVFGMRFCDLAPAFLGDAILRHFRFRIHSA
jgi:short-subunit dehydrogenase